MRDCHDGPCDIIVSVRKRRVLLAVAFLVMVVGCKSRDPFRVATVQLGRSLNADKTVARHTTTFIPSETIYVSVITAGNGAGTVSVRWWLADRLVSERQTPVSSRDEPIAEFHLQ